MLTDEQREEAMGSIRADIRQALMNHANAMIGTSLTDTVIALRGLFEQEKLYRSGEEISVDPPIEYDPWIKVEDELPPYGNSVLLAHDLVPEQKTVSEGFRVKTDADGEWWEMYGRKTELLGVVAWMPVPEYKS